MKIVHNVSLNPSWWARRKFRSLGIELGEGFSNFKIEESQDNWTKVRRLINRYNAADIVTSVFSAEEIEAAHHLQLLPSWHYGYPEPADDGGYLSGTYDTTNYCAECGCGLVQNAPFKFRNEPKWGRRRILQLNWVFDEFFVPPEIWESVFKPFGIEYGDVVHARKGHKLDTVVQLIIPNEDVSLKIAGYDGETCKVCGCVKTWPISRGFFPPFEGSCDKAIFKPTNCFGSGANSHCAVIVSSELCSKMQAAGMHGVEYTPLDNEIT